LKKVIISIPGCKTKLPASMVQEHVRLKMLAVFPAILTFCSVLADPGHEDHERLMEWSGGHYDSEEFDADMVNWELMKYLRWSRDRYKDWGWNQ